SSRPASELCLGKNPRDAHYPKVRLYVILPALPGIDPLFTDVQGLVNRHCTIGVEYASSIGHNSLWSTVITQSFGEYPEVGSSVLLFRDGRCKQHARKIFQNADHIHRPLDVWKLMVLD